MKLDAKVFDIAAYRIKERIGVRLSCIVLACVTSEKRYRIFWEEIHMGYNDDYLTIASMETAAKYAGIDKNIFREQLLRELAYSLRYQGFSK